MQAIVFPEPNRVTVRKLELKPCEADEIVVRTHYSFVSPGTELRCLSGFMAAKYPFPVIPGYSVVGEVVKVGAAVKGYRVGDLVSGRNPRPVPGVNACWGGQASAHVYATSGVDRPILLPAGSALEDYVAAEVSAICLRGVEAAAPEPGETAVVVGQGLIGAFSAHWLQLRGCRVIVADLEPGRLRRAMERGVSAAVNVRESDALERLLALCDGGADIVVESSGTTAGAMMAYKLVRRTPRRFGSESRGEDIAHCRHFWPRLVMQATYTESVTINPFNFFAGEGVTLIAPIDRSVQDRMKAVEAIRLRKLRSADFVQRTIPFNEAPDAYTALRDDKNANFSLMIDWRNAG